MEDGQLQRRLVQVVVMIMLFHKPRHALILLRKMEGAIVLQLEEPRAPYPVVLAAQQRLYHVLPTTELIQGTIRYSMV